MKTNTTKRTVPNHAVHHRVSSSHTLMRKAVSKPSPSLKRKLRISPALDTASHSIVLEGQPKIVHGRTPSPKVKKSDKIRHFINMASHTPPASLAYDPLSSDPIVIEPSNNHASVSTKPAPVKSSLDLILERGLERATSHLEPSPSIRRKKKHANTLAITSVILLALTVATVMGENPVNLATSLFR